MLRPRATHLTERLESSQQFASQVNITEAFDVSANQGRRQFSVAHHMCAVFEQLFAWTVFFGPVEDSTIAKLFLLGHLTSLLRNYLARRNADAAKQRPLQARVRPILGTHCDPLLIFQEIR